MYCVFVPSSLRETDLIVSCAFQGNYQPNCAVTNGGILSVLLRLVPVLANPPQQCDLLHTLCTLAETGAGNAHELSAVGIIEAVLNDYAEGLRSDAHPLHSYLLRLVEAVGTYRLQGEELRKFLRVLRGAPLTVSAALLRMAANGSSVPFIQLEYVVLSLNLGCSAWIAMLWESVLFSSPHIVVLNTCSNQSRVQIASVTSAGAWPPSSGYTLACWLCIDASTATATVPLCTFVSADEKSTLQATLVGNVVSVRTGDKTAVEFPPVKLELRHWHHLAIVHQKHLIMVRCVRHSEASTVFAVVVVLRALAEICVFC